MCAAKDDYLIKDLHCILQAQPAEHERTQVVMGERSIEVLRVPPHLQSIPLDVSFERVMEQLQQVPSCHSEPDGWFVWTGFYDEVFWSVRGQMTDNGQKMLFVELKGDCPASMVRSLSQMLGGGERPLMFQLPGQGVFLTQETFYQLHSAESPASG